jgi:hypothetical protein
MEGVRKVADKLRLLMFPDQALGHGSDGSSPFAGLQMPHTFAPNLGAAQAFFAFCGSLARIFGTCLWLALWGGASAWIWTALGNRNWRMAAAIPLVLFFLAGLAGLMIAIAQAERWMNSICRRLRRE